MSCTTAEMALLLEHIERVIYDKAVELGMPPDNARKLITEIEMLKQTLIEKGISRILRDLGI